MFNDFWFVMLRDGHPYQMDLSSHPVNSPGILCQPGVSQNDGVLIPEVQCKEVLSRVLSIDPEMQFNLIVNHSSLIVGSISVSGIHRSSEFFQQPSHSSGEVKVNARDCCPIVN